MRNAKKGKNPRKGRIESRISLPSDIPTEDISAKILTSISESVEQPFVNELHKWMGGEMDRRSLTSSLSVSIYSDITFFDGASLNDFDLHIEDEIKEKHAQQFV